MKYIFITCIALILLVFACSPKQTMFNSLNAKYNLKQFDSIIKVEKLPRNMEKWHGGGILVDFETRDTLYQWFFVKELNTKKDTNQIIYTVTKKDTVYKFIKRLVITESKQK